MKKDLKGSLIGIIFISGVDVSIFYKIGFLGIIGIVILIMIILIKRIITMV